MLSQACKYAIRAMVYLAMNYEKDKKIGIKQIAEDLEIPRPFLGKIMQQLAKNKLLQSTKGPHGGFALADDPFDISLYDIVAIIDGTDVFNQCLFGLEVCRGDNAKKKLCPMHAESEPLRKKLLKLYRDNSVGHLAKNLDDFKDIVHL